MTTPRRSRAALPALLAGALLLTLPGVVAAEEEIEGGAVDIFPTPLSQTDFLAPIRNVLGGRAGLIARAEDPTWVPGAGEDDDDGVRNGSDLGGGSAVLQGTGAALVPYRDPGPAFSTNQLITRDFSSAPYQTEPSIAVNPQDSEHLILGTIDYNFPSNSSYVSLDGGESWEGPFHVPYILDDLGNGGDPVVAFSQDGSVAWMAGISIGEEQFTVGPVGVFVEVSSISVARSDDGGFTWPQTISSARSRVTTDGLTPDRFGRLRGNLSIGFLDKPWLTVGPDPEDPTRDVIYATYTDFETEYTVLWLGEVPTMVPVATRSTIRMVRSEDGGRSWTAPVAVSPTVQQAYGQQDGVAPGVFGTDRTVQGSQPAVGPDGTLTVAWLDSTDDESMKGAGEIYVARSTDKGDTFGTPIVASTFNEIAYRPRSNYFRFWASEFPQIGIAPDGKTYIAYAAKPPERERDDADIYIVMSDDDGQTWSRPKRLNDDGTDMIQFFPSLDVAPDASVHVMWGDMRDDPTETRYNIYYTASTDAGETWGFEIPDLDLVQGDTRVSDYPSNPNRGFPGGRFLGDYFSLAAADDEVYMVWADTRLGEYGAPNQKIGFARKQAIAAPELFLSPPSGPGGQQVTLQGFGYQPELNVYIQLGDSTIAMARTDDTGTFTTVFYMPITSEGSQNVSGVDESGNRASTSYFTEFGFGNIADQLADLREQLDALNPEASPAP